MKNNEEGDMPNHNVKISVERKRLKYDRLCVEVEKGDTITWKVDVKSKKEKEKEAMPFAIIVKSFISPLVWGAAVSESGKKTLVGTVRDDAEPGFYHYGTCLWDGKDLLVDDPEIIVRPPKGGK
jgi:plastocyanin